MKTFNNKRKFICGGILLSAVLLTAVSCTKEETTSSDQLLESSSINASTVNSTNHKEHDFDNNSIAPFEEDQGISNIAGEGMSFVNSTISGKMLKIHWKESEYDGSRRERGHEIKLRVTTNSELFSGFYFRADNKGTLMKRNTIIWQLYNWGSGCSNWTAHLELKNNDLYLSYRQACVNPTVVKIYDNLSTGRNYKFQIRANVSGNKTGRLEVRLDGKTITNRTGINLGFGDFDSNDNAKTSVVGVKMGLYCFDTSNYTNNEERIIYLDNVGACVRSGSVTDSWNRIDPARGN